MTTSDLQLHLFYSMAEEAACTQDHTGEQADWDETFRTAVLADLHFDAAPHQCRGDVGLEVGEAEHQVGLERHDLFDVLEFLLLVL